MKPEFECQCDNCQSACQRKPGWFAPGESGVAATLLQMTEKEFFDKYLMIDWYGATDENKLDEDILILSPRLTHVEGGSMAPWYSLGQCVFYVEGKCQIHEAKPYECAKLDHQGHKETHQEVALLWKDHQDEIHQLNTQSLEQPELDFESTLRLLMGGLK